MNTLKAVELLNLPEEVAQFEGQIRIKTTRRIVVTQVYDFTSGKLVRQPNEVSVQETSQQFGAYAFNFIANYIHHFNHEYVGVEDGVLRTIRPFKTTPSGSWFGEQKLEVFPNELGYQIDVTSDPLLNANRDGSPANYATAKLMSGLVVVRQKSITKDNATGAIKTFTGKVQFPSLTREQAFDLTGMTLDEIAESTRVSWQIVKVDNSKFVTSIAMDITQSGNSYSGEFYVNGMPANSLTLSSLTTSYGKPCPSFVFRWLLYNTPPTSATVYGQSAMAQFTASDANTVTIVEGTSDGYDAGLKQFTVNYAASPEACIVATAEFLPATGKQETVGRMFNLETGIELNY